jgi:hypothetical protein
VPGQLTTGVDFSRYQFLIYLARCTDGAIYLSAGSPNGSSPNRAYFAPSALRSINSVRQTFYSFYCNHFESFVMNQ